MFRPTFYFDADSGAAGDPPTPTGIAAGVSGVQPDLKALYDQAANEAAEWKKRFTGLQGTYQREQQKWASEKTRITELEGLMAGLDTERGQLRTQLEGLEALKTEAEKAKTDHARLHTVVTKFPGLLPIVDSLPDGSGPEWEVKLTKLVEHMTNTNRQTIQNTLEGAVPPAPRGEAPKSGPELLNAAIAAMRKGDLETYNQLYSQYVAASEQQGVKQP